MSLFLVERIMQQPIPTPLHFRAQVGFSGGFSGLEPMGYWVGVLCVKFQCLLNAVLNCFCSGGDPICKFGGR